MKMKVIIFGVFAFCFFCSLNQAFRMTRMSYPKLGAPPVLGNLVVNRVSSIKPAPYSFKLFAKHGHSLSFKIPSIFGLKEISISPTAANMLIASNTFVHLASYIFPQIPQNLMKIDSLITKKGEYYRLFSALFVHGSLYHLFMNSLSLIRMGSSAEKTFGSFPFLLTYITSGVLANLLTYFLNTSPISMGASSSVFGITGAFVVYFVRNKRILGTVAENGKKLTISSLRRYRIELFL